MNKSSRWMLMISFFCFLNINVLSQELDINRPVINPLGWKLPDVAYLEKVSTETKIYCGIPQRIIVETYKSTEKIVPSLKLPYYILDKQIIPGRTVNLNAEVREWVEGLKIFKKEYNNETICYLFDCVVEGEPRDKDAEREFEEGRMIDGVGGGWQSRLIVDLDSNGTFESLFSADWKGFTQEEITVFVLKLKLGIE